MNRPGSASTSFSLVLRTGPWLKDNYPQARDLAAGLSLANLCLLEFWHSALAPNTTDLYFSKTPPQSSVYLAAILIVTTCGLLGALAMRWAWHSTVRWQRWLGAMLLAGFVLVLLNILRVHLTQWIFVFFQLSGPKAEHFATLRRWPVAVGLTALSGMAFLTWGFGRCRNRLPNAARFVLLGLSPFMVANFARSAWKMATYSDSGFRDKPVAQILKQNGPHTARVLWIIFDEWDQRLTFENGVQFPEIRQFRDAALYASNAYPPADGTDKSMLAFLTGKIVRKAEPQGPDRLRLLFWDGGQTWLDGEQDRPGSSPSLFTKIREAHVNAAVVGWRVPYGRLFNRDLVSCWWTGFPQRWNLVEGGFLDVLLWQLRSLFGSGSGIGPFGRSMAIQKHTWIYKEVLERGKLLVSDPAIGLALIHFPVPHMPAIYDAATGRLDRRYSTPRGYFDNLSLVDRTIRELREAMERAGEWSSATVLLSSDHWHRGAASVDGKVDRRVPFLLKLAGQQRGIVYDKPFNTVLTHDLILSIFRGELRTPDQVVAWLDVHRQRAEGQYHP